LAVLEGMVR
jgi:DNA anti-recombination protein RmuC